MAEENANAKVKSKKKKKRGKRRAKGTGTLIKRGKKWYVRWKYNGEEHCESTGKTKLEEAMDVAMEKTQPLRLRTDLARAHEMERQILGLADKLKKSLEKAKDMVTVEQLTDLYRNSSHRLDSSEEQLEDMYLRAIRMVVDFMGKGKDVTMIGEKEAERYADDLAKKVSPNTFNKRIMALKEVWRAVGASAGITTNPWASIKRKRQDTQVRRVLTDKEVDEVIGKATGELKKLLAIGAYTGLRMGDAINLRWSSIRGKNVDVRTSKTGANVSIPLHPKLEKELGKRKADGLVLRELPRKYKTDAGGISKMVTRHFAACGIETSVKKKGDVRSRPLCTFHSLRHTFVSRAIEAGVPMHVIQSIVGHSTIMMTEHYTHVTDKAIIKAMNKVK